MRHAVTIPYSVGQRVRIEEEDAPPIHLGKMASIESVLRRGHNEPLYVLRVDRFPEPVSLPHRYLRPITPKPSSLLANDLFLPWDAKPNERFQQFTTDRWLAGRVLESLLFYERVVVPTVDYSIIVPMIHWFGPGLIDDMLAGGALSFVRFTGNLAYVGNGVGLALYEIHPSDQPEEWWMWASRCAPCEAVALQIERRLEGLKADWVQRFAKLVEICTVDTALPQFTEKVEHETYRDILASDLRIRFSHRNNDLKRLVGLQPNQLRMLSRITDPGEAGDEIDTTLRLGMLNLEAYLADEAGVRDMVTDGGFGELLGAKFARYTAGRVASEAFSSLITLEQLPDLPSAVKNREVDPVEVWKFRNSKNAGGFREWFDEFGPTNPIKLQQEYVGALKSVGALSGLKARIARFIVVNAVSGGLALLLPVPSSLIAPLGISAADSFLLDRIRLGYNPRYFIDEYRHNFFSG